MDRKQRKEAWGGDEGENGRREKRRQRSSAGSFFTRRGRDSLSSRINVLY